MRAKRKCCSTRATHREHTRPFHMISCRMTQLFRNNKLMHLKIFSVSIYIHFGRGRQRKREKTEIKTDWLKRGRGVSCVVHQTPSKRVANQRKKSNKNRMRKYIVRFLPDCCRGCVAKCRTAGWLAGVSLFTELVQRQKMTPLIRNARLLSSHLSSSSNRIEFRHSHQK